MRACQSLLLTHSPCPQPLPMTSTTKPLNVLFLCTHNSARSILAEALLNGMAGDRFRAFSAGSSPRDNQQPNPLALEALQRVGMSTEGLRSKSWDEFAAPGAPEMRIVITVCDQAAAETCPWWPGSPVKQHWGYADPSRAPEAERAQAFELTRQAIGYRMLQLLALPLDAMGDAELQRALAGISRA